VRVIEGTGADERDGTKAVCSNCKQEFDERGGIIFDGQDRAGLCPECANEVVALVSDPDSSAGER
jgi:hypothetical protein